MYQETGQICMPPSVMKWAPNKSYLTFVVRENAGEKFAEVNNQVKKVCEDIDELSNELKSLKNLMGDNTGTSTEIDRVVKALSDKRADLVTKNQELIAACNKVVDYISKNKTSKLEEASAIARTIENISIYNGE